MKCAQCEAFESTFKAAGLRFAASTYSLEEKVKVTILRDAEYRELEREVESARDDYKMAKEALRVHVAGHRKA